MKKSPGKEITVAFLGNAYYDSRIINLMHSFDDADIDYRVISYDWSEREILTDNPRVKVIKLQKSPRIKFYLRFFRTLFFSLIKTRSKIYIADDVYTLPLCVFAAKLSGGKVYYNSRELYGFLAGLRNKNKVQKIIADVERRFIKYADVVMTTGEMDSEFIEQEYNLSGSLVIRNLPGFVPDIIPKDLHKLLNIPNEKKIILYQGVVLEGRGINKVIDLIGNYKNIVFVVIGDGDFRPHFEQKVQELSLGEQVIFYGRVPHEELLSFTAGADFGLALIENISKSYYYALPNKLFEYIMAGIPVISSNLPQMEKIVNDYKTGIVIDPENSEELEKLFTNINNDKIPVNEFKKNAKEAAKELNWENEYKKLAEVIRLHGVKK